VGVAFADAPPVEERLALLRQRGEALKREPESTRAFPPHEGMTRFVIEHYLLHLESELRWLDQLITSVEGSSDPLP